jgi:quinol monooxygenase YgiN
MTLTYVFLRLSVPADKTPQGLLDVAEKLTAPTVREEGCIYYHMRKEDGDENNYFMLEKWASKEALEAHQKTEHFTRLLPELMASAEITSLKVAADHFGSVKPQKQGLSSYEKAVRLIVGVKVNDEPHFFSLANEMTEASLAEEGCIEYSFARVEGSPDEYAYIELWKSEEALHQHSASAHCDRLIPLMDHCSTVTYIIKSYESFSP